MVSIKQLQACSGVVSMRGLAAVVFWIVAAVAVAVLRVTPAYATHVPPQFVQGNQTCSALTGIPGIQEFKIQPVEDGTYSDGLLEVMIDVRSTPQGDVFDWSSTGGQIMSIFVKGGPDGNLYEYGAADPPVNAVSDTGLHSPLNPSNGKWYGLSHISFCYLPGAAEITVTKSCTNATIENGNTFTAMISGTVENTGDVTLLNVQFDDVESGAPAGPYDIRRPDNSVFNEGDSLAVGEVLTYTAQVSSTTETTHSDTITWSGVNAFNAADVAMDSATAPSGQEVCSVNPVPSITITKDCGAAGVDTGFKTGIFTFFVNTAITVTNDGLDESLSGVSVSDPEGGLSWVGGHPFTCNAAGTSCTANSDMPVGASADFTQLYNPDSQGVDILGNLDIPETVEFYNKASTSGAGVLSGIPVGDMDDTTCPLCQ